MTLLMLLEMIASAFGDRLGIGTASDGLTYRQLHDRAGAGAEVLRRGGHQHLAYLASSEPAFPIALFAAAWAGVPFLPLNYRLGKDQLRELLSRHADVLVIADEANLALLDGLTSMSVEAWNAATAEPVEAAPSETDGEDIAVLLYTSGTTSAPKAVVLRHRHLTSYVIAAVEFAGADEADATLVSVPPYHIAGVANALSNIYAGRRIVYFPAFTAERLAGHRAGRGHQPRHGRAHDAGPGRRAPRRRRSGLRRPAVAGLRRGSHARHGPRTGAAGLPHDRLRERLRPDRDQLHDRRPRPRRPPGRAGRRRGGAGSPGVGRAAGAGHRGRRARRARSGCGASRSPGSTSAPAARSTTTAGSRPATAAGWTTTATSSSRAGPTTRSSAAARTSRRPRWRTCCSSTPACSRRPWSASPTTSGASAWRPRSYGGPVPPCDADELRAFALERLRSSKTPDVIAFRDDLPHTDTGKLLRRAVLADLQEAVT